MASVPHNYMLGAFTYGWFAGTTPPSTCAESRLHCRSTASRSNANSARIYAPLDREHGLPPAQVEYKLRRFVNDYLQPPKVTKQNADWLQRFSEIERRSGADEGEQRRMN